MRLRRAMWSGLLWIGATTVAAANPVSPGGSVVDMAGVLDTDTMLQIDSTLSTYADATGFTLAVVTVDDLADDGLQDYARVSLRAYVAAQGDPEARVALLMWSSARQFLIAVSPAFGRELSPTEVAAVLRDQVLPQVTTDDVGAGMLHGVYGLMVAAGESSDEAASAQELVMVTRWGADAVADTTMPAAQGDAPADAPGPAGVALDEWVQAFRDDPGAAVTTAWAQAQTQWTALRAQALGARLAGGVDGPGAVAPWAIAGLVALAILAGLWRATRSLVVPAVSLGLVAAGACWALTSYAELSVVLALSGIATAIVLRLLQAVAGQHHEARLQPSPYAAMTRMPQPQLQQPPPMAAPTPAPPRSPPTPAPESRAQEPAQRVRHSASDFGASLARAHRDGVRTPMFDYLIANKDRLKASAATRKQQRQYWLIAIVIGFFVFLPLALILMMVWIVRELSHVKPPQVSMAAFLRQLIAEVRAVSRYQKPGA